MRQYFHLLILELQGEVPVNRFKLCLANATKQLEKDRQKAIGQNAEPKP